MPDDKGEYVILKYPDVPRAGLLKSPMAGAPPHWVGFLHVDDLDATLDRVQQLGGKRLNEPESVEGIGRFCMVQDDQGASIGLITPSAQA